MPIALQSGDDDNKEEDEGEGKTAERGKGRVIQINIPGLNGRAAKRGYSLADGWHTPAPLSSSPSPWPPKLERYTDNSR